MAETEFEMARCASRFLKTYTIVARDRAKQAVAGLNA
jgi:hypothetical protein